MDGITEISTEKLSTLRGLTPKHLARRRNYITASDLPAIAGLDPFRWAGDVYLDKTEDLAPSPTSAPAAIGLCVEPGLRRMVEHTLGVKLTRAGAWVTNGILGATLDDVVKGDRKSVVQYKARGSSADLEHGPPERDIVQVHAEMVCAEADVAYLAYLLGSFGPLSFRLFKVERDSDLAAGVQALAEKFMREHIKPRIAPNPTHIETLARVIREPGKRAVVSDASVNHWRAARETRLAAEKVAERYKGVEQMSLAVVLHEMGDAEYGDCSFGTLEYPERSRKAYSVEEKTFRTAVFKELNGGNSNRKA